MPYSREISFPWVPLPAPWGPSRRMSKGTSRFSPALARAGLGPASPPPDAAGGRMPCERRSSVPSSTVLRAARSPPLPAAPEKPEDTLLQEAFVGAHHHLRLHLTHRVQRDADDDQHRSAAEGARG